MEEQAGKESAPTRDQRGRRRRRLRRVLVVLVLLLLGLYVFRVPLLGAAAGPLLRSQLADAGFEARLGRLSGGGFSDLRIEFFELRALEATENPLRRLALRDVRVAYSLSDLIAGRLSGLHEVAVERAEVELDLARQGAGSSEPGPPLADFLPATLPRLTLRDADVRLVAATGERFELRGLSVACADGEELTVRGRVLGQGLEPFTVDTELAVRARYAPEEITVEEAAATPYFEELRGSASLAELGAFDLRGTVLGSTTSVRAGAPLGAYELDFDVSALELSRIPVESLRELAGTVALKGTATFAADAEPRVDARLTADRLDVAGYRVDLLTADLGLVGKRLSVREANVKHGEDVLTLARVELDLGAPDARALLRTASGQADLTTQDLPGLLDTRLPDIEVPPHRLQVRADLQGGRAEIAEARLELLRGEVRAGPGSFVLPEDDEGWLASTLDVQLRADLPEVRELALLFGVEDAAGSLRGDLRAAGPLQRLAGSAALRGSDLSYAGRDLGELVLDADIVPEAMQVRDLSLSGGDVQVAAAGRVSWRERTVSEMQVQLEVPALERVVPAYASAGRLRANANVDGPWTAPRFAGEWELEAGAFPDAPVRAARGRARSDGEVLLVERLDLAGDFGEVTLAGELRDPYGAADTVRLEELHWSAGDGELNLARPATFRGLRPRDLGVEGLELAGSGGRAVLELDWTEETARANAVIETLAPDPYLRGLLPDGWKLGQVDGTLTLDVGSGEPEIRFALTQSGLQLDAAAPTVDLRLDGLAHGGFVQIDVLEVRSEGIALEARASAPFAPTAAGFERFGPGEVQAEVTLECEELSVLSRHVPALAHLSLAGAVRAQATLAGTWRELTGYADVRGQQLVVDPDADSPWPGAGMDLEARVDLSPERLLIHPFDVTSAGGLAVRSRGEFDLRDHAGFLTEESLAQLRGAPMDVDIELETVPIENLSEYFEGVRRLAGEVTGRGHLRGTLDAPDWEGTFALRNGSASIDPRLPSVEDLALTVEARGAELKLKGEGELGGSPTRIDGRIALGAVPRLDLNVGGENVLLYRDDQVRARADADLVVRGPVDALHFTGDVRLTEGWYLWRIHNFESSRRPTGPRGLKLFSVRSGPLATATFDVNIGHEQPFRVEGTAKGTLRPELRLTGTGEVPILLGRVYLDPTSVSLPAGQLRLSAGTVQFREDNPFLPSLDVEGGARMYGYDVSVYIDGPYDSPEIHLSSIPPLPNEDLFLMVFAGQRPRDTVNASAAASEVALYVAREILQAWFDDPESTSESFLDRFELVMGRDVSESGNLTMDASFRLKKDWPRENQALFLTAEQDVYDRTNWGLRLRVSFGP